MVDIKWLKLFNKRLWLFLDKEKRDVGSFNNFFKVIYLWLKDFL